MLEKSTFRWKYHDTLEPPKVVHARKHKMPIANQHAAQVTVRLHTAQVRGASAR